MASFTASTDFDIPPYDIPSLTPKVNGFNAFCLNEQETILRRLLGNELYNLFEPQIAVIPVVAPVEQIWIDLAMGASYLLEGDEVVYNWVGIKKLLQPYIYSIWLKSRVTIVSNAGPVRPKPENATVENYTGKIYTGNVNFRGLVGNRYNKKNTLYGFLTAKAADYPTWKFTDPFRVNPLGM